MKLLPPSSTLVDHSRPKHIWVVVMTRHHKRKLSSPWHPPYCTVRYHSNTGVMIPHWWFDLVIHSAWYLFVFVFHLKKNIIKKHQPQLNPYHPEWSCKVTFLTFLPSSTSILLANIPQIGKKSKIHDQISQWWHSNNNRTDQKLAKIIASLAIISANFNQDN